MLDGNSQCVPSANKCSPHQYIDQHGECHPCHKYCYRCSGPGKTHCLSCNPRHLLLSESSSFFFLLFLVELMISLKAVCPGKLVRHLWCLLSPRDRVCLLVQMAPVWINAQQATTSRSLGRNANPATLPVSPVLESTTTSASHVKPTYFERAKNAWRPASTGSLTCPPVLLLLIHHIITLNAVRQCSR